MAIPVWVVPLIAAAGGIVKSLIEKNAQEDSMDALKDGFSQATKTINDANKKAFEMLDPYLKGGQADYERHRQLSNSGYYDTPYSGTYQPQAFQNQAVTPGQFNPQTQSYGSNYQPMEFRPMGLLSSPSLPKPPPMQQQPQGPGQPINPMIRPNAMPNPVEGALAQVQQGMKISSPVTDAYLPNKNAVPNRLQREADPTGLMRSPNQPLTLEEISALLRQGRGGGPFMPGYMGPGYGGGLLGTGGYTG